MTQPPALRGAARVLSSEGGLGDQAPVAAPSEQDRTAAIAAIAAAMRSKNQRRAAARWGTLAVLAAAATVAVFVGVRARAPANPGAVASASPAPTMVSAGSVAGIVAVPMGGAVTPIRAGRPGAPLSGPSTLAAGDRLVAGAGAVASLSLPTGTRLELRSGGDLGIVEQGAASIFSLGAGSMRADVHKLEAGQRFVVRTVDAEVEVRGTSFQLTSVEPDAGCPTRTRLVVYEGVVVVRALSKETFVRAGEHWPVGCGASAPSVASSTVASVVGPIAPTAPPSVASGGGASAASASAATPLPSATVTVPSSELPAALALYDAGITAKQNGDLATAVARFDEYLAQYPHGQNVEAAEANRMRALYKLDRARAVVAAKAYLARYPAGLARDDAQTILDHP